MCLTPYTLNTNKHNSPKLRHTQIVPCGKCIECLRSRQSAWAFRLKQELKQSLSSVFLTLTYEDQPISFNGHPTLEPIDLKNFWKRLRKKSTLHKIKYYAVGEYGSNTLRPHYHAIVFNIQHNLLSNPDTLQDIWKHGTVHIGESNQLTMNYTASYIMKGSWQPLADHDDRYPNFARMSQGLGKSYLTPSIIKYHKSNLIPFAQQSDNTLINLPRYYKEKIFNPSERSFMAAKAEAENNMDWNEFANRDYQAEQELFKSKIRTHERKTFLSNHKL
jgi:hypothetical protein